MIRCPVCTQPHETRPMDEVKAELARVTLQALGKDEDDARAYLSVQLSALAAEMKGGCIGCCSSLATSRTVQEAEAQLHAVSTDEWLLDWKAPAPGLARIIPLHPQKLPGDAPHIGVVFNNGEPRK